MPGAPPGIVIDAVIESGIEVRSSGDMQNVLSRAGWTRQVTDGPLAWALLHWKRGGRPIFVMDEDLAWALVNTEPPMENFDLLPVLPANGMYICLPPIFAIENLETGQHRIEGVYIVEDIIAIPQQTETQPGTLIKLGTDGFETVPGITIIGVGEDKSTQKVPAWVRDDALLTFHLAQRMPLMSWKSRILDGTTELLRLVVNFLYILQNTDGISQVRKEVTLPKKMRKRDPRKFDSDPRSVLPYTVLSLMKEERSKEKQSQGSKDGESGRTVKGHIVLGHVHHYWVKDNGVGLKKLGERQNTKGTKLALVAKWLRPYHRGQGPAGPKTVSVRP
jgi:hypothetical protein